MTYINENYLNLKNNYLFSEIAKRVKEYQQNNPEKDIVKLGIGDVTRPISKTISKFMNDAVDDMTRFETFKGYGPEQGYDFLREKIVEFDYKLKGVTLSKDEIFISDGAKCDTGNIGDILSLDNVVAVTDPVYPVYVDTNIMAGRKIVYLNCNKENNFIPEFPSEKIDVLYLCLPNNPTGIAWSKDELKKWVDYARENNILILYDAAYESYICEKNVAHSIYEIEGAKEVAIEFRSFSKNAGFTGLRCGFIVVPKELEGYTKALDKVKLNELWNRRQTTKFNGASYIIQKGAEAIYTTEGKEEVSELVNYYMQNAKLIREGLSEIGFEVFGGINSPYIWLKTPNNMDSWEFFNNLLNKANVVGTPGSGFGKAGEGYFRLTAFGTRENTIEALNRIRKYY